MLFVFSAVEGYHAPLLIEHVWVGFAGMLMDGARCLAWEGKQTTAFDLQTL
jgi:hypothetical protein